MTKEDKYADEIMSDEELEQVAGGTIAELDELVEAFSNNRAFRDFMKIITHTPGENRKIADRFEGVLKDKFNIDADISLGLDGTGVGSSPNTYRDMKTGKYISHAEVVDRLKKHYQS